MGSNKWIREKVVTTIIINVVVIIVSLNFQQPNVLNVNNKTADFMISISVLPEYYNVCALSYEFFSMG
jgi:hypothetical protein